MNSTDWLDYSKQKPQNDQHIVYVDRRTGARGTCKWNSEHFDWITHWQPWAEPPKLDGFDAWWGEPLIEFASPALKDWARSVWDAALAWQKGQS